MGWNVKNLVLSGAMGKSLGVPDEQKEVTMRLLAGNSCGADFVRP